MALTLLNPKSAPDPQLASNGEGSIFHQPWWLQASAGKALEEVSVVWDGRVVGSMAFVRRRKYGFRVINMPPYCHTLGPVLNLPAARPAQNTRNMRRVVRELMEKLPGHDRFHCILDPDDPSNFAFVMAGCSIQQDFTFRFDANQDLEEHWKMLDQKTRNLVRTAGKRLQLRQNNDLDGFLHMCVRERKQHNTHNMPALRSMGEAVLARGLGRILTVDDERGRPAASCFLVWDDRFVYYWQSTRDPEYVVPGANNLLVWEAIRFAAQSGRTFDLDGYGSEGAARFGAKFGIKPIARASVVHMSKLGQILRAINTPPNCLVE